VENWPGSFTAPYLGDERLQLVFLAERVCSVQLAAAAAAAGAGAAAPEAAAI
jgi:hypothetical protein